MKIRLLMVLLSLVCGSHAAPRPLPQAPRLDANLQRLAVDRLAQALHRSRQSVDLIIPAMPLGGPLNACARRPTTCKVMLLCAAVKIFHLYRYCLIWLYLLSGFCLSG